MNHTFDVDIAIEYGADVAVIVSNLEYWIMKNKANKTHIHDGKVWTYNSVKAFSELFPYWTDNQIRRILATMKDKGIIETGNYNKLGYDRTIWYTFTDAFLLNHKSICGNAQIDLAKNTNGFGETQTPIPDSKQNSKPNDKPYKETDEMSQAKSLASLLLSESRKHDDKLKIGKDEATIKSWAVDIEKLLRIDQRDYSKIEQVIKWCKEDGNFWIPNILSGKKLRDKFPTLIAQMELKPAKKKQFSETREAYPIDINKYDTL